MRLPELVCLQVRKSERHAFFPGENSGILNLPVRPSLVTLEASESLFGFIKTSCSHDEEIDSCLLGRQRVKEEVLRTHLQET